MLRLGDKLGYKLSKRFGQVSALPTVSTIWFDRRIGLRFLCGPTGTLNAQFFDRYTQALMANYNLLFKSLYPVSTVPINNTI